LIWCNDGLKPPEDIWFGRVELDYFLQVTVRFLLVGTTLLGDLQDLSGSFRVGGGRVLALKRSGTAFKLHGDTPEEEEHC
jgi:hypothetical protein